jgi:hypothetical protein
MLKNMIYDPCFEVAGRDELVICGANPISHQQGFALELDQPLPPRHVPSGPAQPWLIELGDSAVCEAATETMAFIDNEPVRYPCRLLPAERSQTSRISCGLLDTLRPGKVWTATKVCFEVVPSEAGPPFKPLSRKTVSIRRLWE